MRRMYSQAELSAIIKEVFLEDVASGQIDLPDLIEQALPEVDFSTADFSGVDFEAKTLNQSQPNKEFEVELVTPTYLTHTAKYEKALIVNNVLYLILAYSLENATEEAHSEFILFNFTLDDDTASKIYCEDGTTVNDPYTAPLLICGFPAYRGSALNLNNNGDVRKIAKNKIQISITSQSLNAGTSPLYEGRNFLMLF